MAQAKGESTVPWSAIVQEEVERTLARLPDALREQAETLPVTCEARPSQVIAEEIGHDDLLGLFVGTPHGFDHGLDPMPPQILLFLEPIRVLAEDRMDVFRREVRITYLHELGHYLGLDEGALTERGLE